MKKLQNNYTTPEQSKRLLELGVPADSANCYYETFDSHDPNDFRLEVRQNPKELSNSLFNDYHRLIPCWSVGRLIEIFEVCTGSVWQNEIIDGYSKIYMLLEDFEDVEKKYKFDFSKLEE